MAAEAAKKGAPRECFWRIVAQRAVLAAGALDEVAALLDRARSAGVPVIHIQPNGGAGSPYDIDAEIGAIVDRVAPREGAAARPAGSHAASTQTLPVPMENEQLAGACVPVRAARAAHQKSRPSAATWKGWSLLRRPTPHRPPTARLLTGVCTISRS